MQASESDLGKMEQLFRERLIAHVADQADPPEFASAMEIMRPLLQRLCYLPPDESGAGELSTVPGNAHAGLR